ncbi:MAG: hypothetical protein VX278_05300, partial [Myxococcota bacterium]|nr:hypothetical protein [Myxococcota bacterium]
MSQQTKLHDLKAHLLDVHNQNIAQNKNKHFCSNAGRWRSEVQKCLRKNDPNQAFTISLYLLQSYAGTEREPTWPWENRSDRKSHKKEEEWLDLLLALNDIVPIPIDLLPGLADWIVDIFNYIPRLLWTKAARLIQRFYFNSQHLAISLGEHPKDITEASVGEKNTFFCEQIDAALRDLFPFHQKKPPKGSIKKIFTHDLVKEKEASLTAEFEQSLDAKRQDLEEAIKDLSKDEQKAKRKQFRAQMQPQKAEIKKTVQLLAKEFLVEKYGAHAHAHRHGLYLLWLIALVDVRLDTGWRHHIFPGGEKVQSWNPIFDKITDPSCTSVLQTALIDARFFPGISYSSDQIGIIHLPLAPEETREWSIDTLPKHVLLIMDQLIQKKITSKALFQKAQLMDVVFDALERNKAYSSDPTYMSLFHWVSLESSDNVSFEACHYDVLFSWITHFSARSQLKSLLGQRVQYWREQSVESQRIHLRTVITELLTESSYRQLTATQRKSHLFDYFLLTRSNAFYGEKDENYSLSFVFQDLYDQLLFAEHPLTKDSPETL